jgi:hypothetical protein
MNMNINERILIVSAFQSSVPHAENIANHEELKANLTLMGVGFIELDGAYKGVPEKSLLFTESNRRVVEMIARDYKQECFLESDNDRYSSLVYADGRRVGLGYLKPVSKSEALALDGYSYRPDLDQYYAIVS